MRKRLTHQNLGVIHTASPLTVVHDGASTAVPATNGAMGSYSPSIGDRVITLQFNNVTFVQGKIA